ncbi:MAG: 3'-5' exonuclease, partial [Syntrophobacterales bacterium]
DLSPDGESQLAAVYRLYQRSLQDKHLVDFDDLIGALVLRWEETPKVLSRHQRFFKFVLVDEFQDINEAQYRWLQLLTATHRNLCVVGDTDQSIYGFRGSNVSIFQRFQVDFPEAQVIKLEQNFRSSQNILEAAGGLIAHNENPLTCKLWSENAPGPLLRVGRLADEEREAQFVVGEIERLLGGSSHYQIYRGSDTDTPDDTPYGFGDFAILYRTHAQSRPLADRLSRAGIPFQVVGEKPPFATQAADALLSYLHYAMDTSSIEDLRVILNLPPRGLGEKSQEWLDEEIDRGKFPWEILRLASKNLDLPVRQQAAMDHLRRTIVSLQKLLATLPLADVLEKAWGETGLRQYYQEGGKSAAESFKWLRLLAGLHGNKPAAETIFGFLDDLSQWRAGDFFDSRADAVALMTLHAAKGLEFPVIFICGLEQDLLPLSHKSQGEDALREERRLFYVGMTRARNLLVLSTVNRRLLYGELLTRQPSTFIKEIPNQFLEEVSKPASKKKRPSKEKQLTLF